jgi:hypothetical protein
MKLSDIDPGSRIMALFKGPPGTRKSSAAASFPGPVKIFDFDRRARALLLWFKDREHEIDISQYDIGDFEKFKGDVEPLVEKCPFGTVVLDSLMPMGKMCIDYTIKKTRGTSTDAGVNAPNVAQRSRGKKIGIMDMPGKEDFGGEARGLSTILELARHIPAHVILIAHVLNYQDTDSSGNERQSQTLLTGGKKIAAEIPIYFDEIYHFKHGASLQGSSGFKVITQSQDKDFARTALGLEPEIDFTDKRLWPLIVEDCKKRGINIEKKSSEEPGLQTQETKKASLQG